MFEKTKTRISDTVADVTEDLSNGAWLVGCCIVLAGTIIALALLAVAAAL
jgi:hypothetical protein